MKTIIFLMLLILSNSLFAATVLTCEDALTTVDGNVEVVLTVDKSENSYSGSMEFFKDGNHLKTIRQTSFYLWSTYGAEVLYADGKYLEIYPDGRESEISGKDFIISRMVAPEQMGMVSVSLKFPDAKKNVSYISRSCR